MIDLSDLRGILFDKDGVLIDYHATFDPLNRAVAFTAANGDAALADAVLRHTGYDDALNKVVGGSLLAVATLHEIADVMTAFVAPDNPTELHSRIVAQLDAGPPETVLVEECAATLHTLKTRGLKLGIATNDSEAGLQHTLGAHGILPLFDFVAAYDSGYGSKPGPGMALAFCDACALLPEEIAMVGDNLHDVMCGRAAEAGACIGVLTGTSNAATLGSAADVVIDSIADLPALLAT
ncbi:MAG: HAD family hydrolase [Pseudomonadota bacterium]